MHVYSNLSYPSEVDSSNPNQTLTPKCNLAKSERFVGEVFLDIYYIMESDVKFARSVTA